MILLALMELILYPNRILKGKCEDVKKFDAELDGIVLDMLEVMRKNNGAGLAAPQVGIKKKIVVVDADGRPFVLINPKIIKSEGKETMEEGCLSFPNIFLKIKRAKKIRVSAQNTKGEKREFDAKEIFAQVLQHEIDHLDGILFIDRLGFFERQKVKQKLIRNRKKTEKK